MKALLDMNKSGRMTGVFASMMLAVFGALALVAPDVAMANSQWQFTPGSEVSAGLSEGIVELWRLVATLAMYAGLIAAIVLYFVRREWVGYAIIIACIGVFGEPMINFMAEIGGFEGTAGANTNNGSNQVSAGAQN